MPKNLMELDEGVFSGCTSLNLTVPDSVMRIEENAFLDVTNVNYNGIAEGSPWGAKRLNGVEV